MPSLAPKLILHCLFMFLYLDLLYSVYTLLYDSIHEKYSWYHTLKRLAYTCNDVLIQLGSLFK